MQSTKPTQFIACFEMDIMDEEERHNFEVIRHFNQTTNEQLSAKCFVIEENYLGWTKCAVFLHSHPIVPDGGEVHEGNMLLINKMLEELPKENKFIYSLTRHIIICEDVRS